MDNSPECARSQLLDLARQVPEQDIPSAARYLECLVTGDSFLRSLLEAPEEEEQLSEECERLLDEAEKEIEAGLLFTHEEVMQDLEDESERSLHASSAPAP